MLCMCHDPTLKRLMTNTKDGMCYEGLHAEVGDG